MSEGEKRGLFGRLFGGRNAAPVAPAAEAREAVPSDEIGRAHV